MDRYIPVEIIYKILLLVSEVDIISYCHTCIHNMKILEDNIFWLNKLDYDFTMTEGAIPSYYVNNYRHCDTLGYTIYKRWKYEITTYQLSDYQPNCFGNSDSSDERETDEMNYIDQVIKGNDDIVLFRLECAQYDNHILEELQYSSIEFISIDVINKLHDIGQEFTIGDVDCAAANGRLDLLDWFESIGIHPTIRGAHYAVHRCKIDVLQWLEIRNILPPQYENDTILKLDTLTIEWLSKRGRIIH